MCELGVVGAHLTHFRLNKLPSHVILEESNFNFRYVWLYDLNIPK